MILGILFLLGGSALVVLAFQRLRGVSDPEWVRSESTRLVIAPASGQDEPRVTLWRGDAAVFGPCWATWDLPAGMSSAIAPLSEGGEYRVAGAVDLAGEDALGTGDPRLSRTLRTALGTSALVLAPTSGRRAVLLHATARGARGSAAGIGIEQGRLDALIGLLGDPTGLRVEVVRRRVQRGGWGGAQDRRQRGRA